MLFKQSAVEKDGTIVTKRQAVCDRYGALVRSGEIEPDAVQQLAALHLDEVGRSLLQCTTSKPTFWRLFAKPTPAPVRGLYLHGGVGRGKTMLMDLFYEVTPFQPKRRLHFHQFMAETHDRIGEARETVEGDPIPTVAAAIAKEAQLLCFDEFHVTDISDAMVLSRLFAALFEFGVVVVATSNSAPDDLYRHGLNRQLFLPFIEHLKDNMDVFELASAKDYRRDKLAGQELYVTPADARAEEILDQHWLRLTGQSNGPAAKLEVKGRLVDVPQALKGVARFSFADLCEKPLGTLDYLQVAQAFHTVLIDHIPLLNPEKRNEARRFINLVDTLYDAGVCLIVSAEGEPDELYDHGDGADLFLRTASRLTEMRSEAYLDARAKRAERGVTTEL
ncbi:MAG: cell division protein ZapE [Hyphomicrobiaceae bacterium]